MKPELLLGKYRIIRIIGKGGFAAVYLCQHIYLKTQAAIKVLRVGYALTEEELNKFLTEARTIAGLSHPHIVRILDFDVEKGIPYLVMEYARNGSLAERYSAEGILPPEAILSYVKQAASALQFAHENQVVHCDIKPGNMLLDQNDRILLSDFGIAVVLDSNLKTKEAVGTMQYMAPEQFVGKPVPASDQYALAVVVYQWLCGQLPFDTKNPIEMYHLHSSVPPRPLREINPRIPRSVEQVVLTALAKDPGRRFTNVRAFAVALEQAMAPKHPSAPPPANSQYLPPTKVAVPEQEVVAPLALLPSLSSLLPSVDSVKKDQAQSPLILSSPSAYEPAEATYRSEPSIHSPHPANPASALNTPDDSLVAPSELIPPARLQFVTPRQEPPASLLVPYSLELGSSNSKTPRLVYGNHTNWVLAVAWSPNGKVIASGSWDTTVQVWDASNGTSLLTYKGHKQPVKSLAWSLDGAYIASGSWDNTVQVWESDTGQMLFGKYRHETPLESVAWSPEGMYIASAGHDGIVQVWHAFNRYHVFSYSGHTGPVWSLAWSPDSKYIASSGQDDTVQVWEALTGTRVFKYRKHKQHVTAVAWSPNGQMIASGDHSGTVHLWAIPDGKTLLQYQDNAGMVKALGWSPDSKRIASAVKLVQVWNITKSLPTAPSFTYTGHTNWVNALTWSPDGQTIASASDDKTVQVWDVR
ncbi:MAG TPA: serine/threonine-protein kinase [Ktedonobacteraceae bacterium]|nr:serine/threonine-protein kinase [Ktedonobacteraceae bacterium]